MSKVYCAFFNETKHKEYHFLSNFFEIDIYSEKDGSFKSSEAYYQWKKFDLFDSPSSIKSKFHDATPQEAYDLSREYQHLVRKDWNDLRVNAMKEVLLVKFGNENLKKQLLDTGDAYIVENCPNGFDDFWADNGNGTGKNMLGHLLMEIRETFGGVGVVPVPSILQLFYSRKCDFCDACPHFTNDNMFYNYCDLHMTKTLQLSNFKMEIHLSDIPTGTGRFLYFNTNDIPELVEEGARLIYERIKELNIEDPYFVTPEASTISMAHILRTKYNIQGIILSKSKKTNEFDTYSMDYCAITSKESKTLYINKYQLKLLEGKNIVIFDNVCTTGETLKAVYNLLIKGKINYNKIKEAIVLFTEGNDIKEIDIADNIKLKVTSFCHLPIFPIDPSIDRSIYKLYSAATMPTEYGERSLAIFRDRTGKDQNNAIVYYHPNTFDNGHENILVRIHDACATSELFDCVKCDCKLQLNYAKQIITNLNGGMIIYLNQEGRGIGLGNKISAYNLQQTQGLDTVEANRALGLPDDIRQYEAVRDILKALKIKSINLLTNNPRKRHCLEKLGVVISDITPCIIEPISKEMKEYIDTKIKKMNHMI